MSCDYRQFQVAEKTIVAPDTVIDVSGAKVRADSFSIYAPFGVVDLEDVKLKYDLNPQTYATLSLETGCAIHGITEAKVAATSSASAMVIVLPQ